MPILDTRRGKDLLGTFIADTVLAVLSLVSATELSHIRQRQAEGIAAAKARGVRFGRPPKSVPANFAEIAEKRERKEISLEEAINLTGYSQTTYYRYLKEYRSSQK
jgi:DNA invertase Pin-like site-specific DNA recombinase